MKHPSYRYSQLKGDNPTYPPEIECHYTQHESSHLFICNYCKHQFLLKSASSIEEMIWHTQSLHQKQANSVKIQPRNAVTGKRYTLEQKLDHLKPPPKYLFKYEGMDIVSDRWLDRLILYGYPVSEIMDNVFKRLSFDSEQYLMNSQRRSQSLLNSKDKVIHSLPQLPLHYLPEQSIDYLTKRYKISRQACKLMLIKYTWSYKKTPQLYQALADLNVRMKVLRQGDNDSCVVFSTPRMRQLYLQYGQTVNLQFKFVPLKRAYNGMHYNVGLFIGQDRGIRMVIFAIVLINGYNYKTIKASIRYFLDIMDHRPPKILVTNHQNVYSQIIKQINTDRGLSIQHMINWYYAIEKLKVDFANQISYQSCVAKLVSALSTASFDQYQSIIQELGMMKDLSEGKLDSFQEESQKFCFAKGKPLFVGFGVQEERIGVITKLVNESFFYIARLGMFYSLAFRLEQKCNSSVQQHEKNVDQRPAQHKIAEMRYLSTILQTNVYTKLNYLYSHSLRKLHIIPNSPEKKSFKIRDSSKYSQSNIYEVNYDIQNQCWRCSCTLIYWSGLPCEHLIKIVRYFRGSISYYINTRWIRDGALENVPKFQVDQDDNLGSFKTEKKMRTHRKQFYVAESDQKSKMANSKSKIQPKSDEKIEQKQQASHKEQNRISNQKQNKNHQQQQIKNSQIISNPQTSLKNQIYENKS